MEREQIEQQLNVCLDKILELEPGSDEYHKMAKTITELQGALLKDLTYEQNRIQATMDREVKEKEIEVRGESEKARSMWGALGVIGAALVGVVVAIIDNAGKDRRIEALREIKDDQGIVDKDLYNLTR